MFYLAAALAVLIVGIAKGGLAGGIGVIGVPLMSLRVEPIQAAAIMLPLLMLMDAFAVRAWWRRWDLRILRTMLPGALLGTLSGWLTFRLLNADAMRIMIGLIAFAFALNWFRSRQARPARSANMARGTLWSTLAGFTSFSVHAGGPPLHVYLLSQHLDKTCFQATSVAFFFVLNWLKLGPYAWLGQLDGSNLATSVALAPLAPLGIWLGGWLHDRINEQMFFRIVYASLAVLGSKLIFDGLSGMLNSP